MTKPQNPLGEKTITNLFEAMRTGSLSNFFSILSDYFASCEPNEDGSFDLEFVKSDILSLSIELWQMKYREEKHFAKITDYLHFVGKNFDNMCSVKYKFEPLNQRWVLRHDY